MTPLPSPMGSGVFFAWRLDREKYARGWDSGEGAFLSGGRWNSRGVRAVYCSLDPSTAILEVAVHKTFRALDVEPHVLTAAHITAASDIHVVEPDSLPNPNWLRAGPPSAGQQAHGDALLSAHKFIVIPSAVSCHSWNLIFLRDHASGGYAMKFQEPFALDPRLHPPAP